jgi:hypothetical protein
MDGTAILKKPENCTPRFIRQSMRHGRQQQLSYDVSLIKLTTTTSTSAANPDITAGLLRHPPP